MKKWSKSIEQLEKDIWNLSSEYPSDIIENIHKFRKIPIQYLTIEQLRFLVNQNIGVSHIIERVILKLQNDILAEGDLYKGDLLSAVSKLAPEYWLSNQIQLQQLKDMIHLNESIICKELSAKEFERINSRVTNIDLSSSK